MNIQFYDNLQLVKKAYYKTLQPVCRQWSLTTNELDVLVFLFNNPEFNRSADIVRHRGIAKSHVSLSVSTLQEKGLLLCEPSASDRRTLLLRLTPQGQAISRQAHSLQEEFLSRLYDGISRQELALWQALVARIHQNIQNL